MVDSGVSDKPCVRGVLEALEKLAMSSAFQGEVGFGRIQKVALFVVGSHWSPGADWDPDVPLAIAFLDFGFCQNDETNCF